MKQSNYNFFFDHEGYQYWFNAINISFFKISGELGTKLRCLIQDAPEIIKEQSESLYNQLVEKGFIIDSDINELDLIRSRYNETIHAKHYSLTILPTLNCNFKCWYCIQNHIPSIMTMETMEKIKRHIKYMVESVKIESLHIDWFGGEPFMFFEQVVKPLSEYAMSLCKDADIPLSLAATSNGYYIDEKTAQILADLKFSHYQITLDGDKEIHDIVKYQKGCESAFEHVLTNIDRLLHISEAACVSLRINYTNDNLTENIVSQVNQYIDKSVRSRIIISPHKVWQESPDPSRVEFISKILDSFENFGYTVQRWNPSLNSIPCYTSREYFNTINYNGGVVKCTACDDLYKDISLGELSDEGAIIWRDDIDKKYQEPTFENERCLSCKGLPICMGQCPRNHIFGYHNCKYDDSDDTLEGSIFEYLKHELSNS